MRNVGRWIDVPVFQTLCLFAGSSEANATAAVTPTATAVIAVGYGIAAGARGGPPPSSLPPPPSTAVVPNTNKQQGVIRKIRYGLKLFAQCR
jgi:hypothetical protein